MTTTYLICFLGRIFTVRNAKQGPMNGGLSMVALGRGDGTFRVLGADQAGVAMPEAAHAVAAVDLDGDGRQELVAAANNGPVQVFRHHTAKPRNAALANSAELMKHVEQSQKLLRMFAKPASIDQALPYAKRLLKIDPHNAEALLVLAKIRRQQGRFVDAQRCLDRLRMQREDDASSIERLVEQGRLCADMGDYDRAVSMLERALKIDPESTDAHEAMGEVRLLQGRLDAAKRSFVRVKNWDAVRESEQQAQVAQLHFTQAQQAEASGDVAGAVRAYAKSLRKYAKNETMRALAKLLQSTSNAQLRDPWYAEQLLQWVDQRTEERMKQGR